MAKKFIIKDEEGKQFEITEETTDEIEEKTDVEDDEMLTSDEIASLKKLAKYSESIIKLLEVEKKEHEAVSDEDEDEEDKKDMDDCDEFVDSDEDEDKKVEDEDEEETIVKTKPVDSKKSFGSIETKKTKKISDSIENREIEIANAWSKRFQSSYKKGE